MDLFNRRKQLETKVEELEAELAIKLDDLKAATEKINDLEIKNALLEEKANGIPKAEHEELVEKHNKLNEDFVKLTEENEKLIEDMKDFDKSAADKAVDIVAECGVDPIAVEQSDHPAMTQQTKPNQRFVITDMKKQ